MRSIRSPYIILHSLFLSVVAHRSNLQACHPLSAKPTGQYQVGRFELSALSWHQSAGKYDLRKQLPAKEGITYHLNGAA